MGVTDFFSGEIATELLKQLITICRTSALCRSSAQDLIYSIQDLLPIIQEIKYSGVELTPTRQRQLDTLSDTLLKGQELCRKVLNSPRWNVYRNLQLARKMESLEKTVRRFVEGPMQAHILADVHHVRFDMAERFDKLEGSTRRLEKRLGYMKLGVAHDQVGWLGEAVNRVKDEEKWFEDSLVNLGAGFDLGKSKVKEMLMGYVEMNVLGISGIAGSGKTTLAREICKDDQIKSYFKGRVYFLTVSQSPNVENLRTQIWKMISGVDFDDGNMIIPNKFPQYDSKFAAQTLVVLDDVWSLSVLEQLIFRIPGCKTLVVSRTKFPISIVNTTFELELLSEDEAMSLFCHFAFDQDQIPLGMNKKLVKQIADKCKGLPLALKVIGSSLRDQPEMFWDSAKGRLTRSQSICESHEVCLMDRMKLSVDCLPVKVRECFLDLAAFPEDKKIPLDVLINIWVELHDIDEEEAFAILVELSDKNLLTLVKDSRSGDKYSTYYEISVSQHDVLRDLAVHLTCLEGVKERRRLLMSRREENLPKEWERNMDQPFYAQLVSIHTGDMGEMDWLSMDFPKTEVLILNVSSSEYALPPFIKNMPKLRALILINYGTSTTILHNLSIFDYLTNLKSLWLEKINVPCLPQTTPPLQNLKKLFLILCNINNSLDQQVIDLPSIFPRLTDFTIDHCINLFELPQSICKMQSLRSLSVTNCDSLQRLPDNISKLRFLQILRTCACPNLEGFSFGIGDLIWLKYLDISQCVNMGFLPKEIGGCKSLEKIDMRECTEITDLPISVTELQSLRSVVCDEDISWLWRECEKSVSGLRVQVAEDCFNLDWLNE